MPEGTPNQTTHMAVALSSALGMKPLFLKARDEEGRVAGQLLCFSGFYAPLALLHRPWGRWALSSAGAVLRTYTWLYGPLIFDRSRYEKILRAILQTVDREASRNGVMVRQAVPPIHNGAIDQDVTRRAFEELGFQTTWWGTIMVDLRPGAEALWNALPKGSRYDVRKAERDGLRWYVPLVTRRSWSILLSDVLCMCVRGLRVPWRRVSERASITFGLKDIGISS